MASIQKISTNLWFDREAEEAAKFYTSIFKNSKMGRVTHYGKEGFEVHHMPEGTAMTVEFWLENMHFIALNGGPLFKFNESVSFIINCESQEEVDDYWDKLKEGGDEKSQVCGWLKDRYGLSWQVIPTLLPRLLSDSNPKKAQAVMKVLLQMKKIDMKVLQDAYEGN